MPILAFSSLLRENKKKSSDKMLIPVGIEPRPLIASDSKSNFFVTQMFNFKKRGLDFNAN